MDGVGGRVGGRAHRRTRAPSGRADGRAGGRANEWMGANNGRTGGQADNGFPKVKLLI